MFNNCDVLEGEKTKAIKIPWQAWYGDKQFELTFPVHWKVRIAHMDDAPNIGDKEIKNSFSFPIGTETIKELAKGVKNVVILVDDLTRPTPAKKVLPYVLNHLRESGVKEDHISMMISLGAHRPMRRDDLVKKLGERIVSRFNIYNHHPFENLTYIGRSTRGTPIYINRFFMNADLKIGIGCITPHSNAGFGGGGKIVVPGVAGIETLEVNHKPAITGISGGLALVEGNENRADIEEIARRVGLNLIVNVVVNSTREIAGVFVGDIVKAHRKGVDLAKKVYSTEVPENMDVGVFNAYPKDTEFSQSANALHVYSSSTKEIVKKGGVIILVTASTEGCGYHSLHGLGMRLPLKIDELPTVSKHIKNRKLIVFSPNLNYADVRVFCRKDVLFFRKWRNVVKELKKIYKNNAEVCVFPNGATQLAQM